MLLIWPSLAVLLGVVAGTLVVLPAPVYALAVAGGLLALVFRRHVPPLLVLIALALGMLRSPHPPGPASRHDLRWYNGRSVQLSGVVQGEPDVRDTGENYLVRALSLVVGTRTVHVTGAVEVHTPRSIQLDEGENVVLSGRLLAPRNTPKIAYADVLQGQGVYSVMRFPRAADQGTSRTGPRAWVDRLRTFLENGINAWLPEPEAALLIAIALGARSASLGSLAPALVATGLIHLVAISGIKIALVAGMISETARRAGSRLLGLVLPVGGIWAYCALTGLTASGMRSTGMWTLVFVAAYLGRRTVAVISLVLVTAVMVAVDPHLPWDIGFEMSVVGTLAIVGIAPLVTARLRLIPSPVREALGVTLVAQAATWPIVAAGFGVTALLGPLANALVLPTLPLLILLGLLLGAFSSLAVIASPLAALTLGLLHVEVIGARFLASAWGALLTPTPPAAITVAYYLAGASVLVAVFRRAGLVPPSDRTNRGRELVLSLGLACALLTASLFPARAADVPELWWLGQGHAAVLRAGDRAVVIDAGSRPMQYLGALAAVLPASQHAIDVVIDTDSRASNVAGLAALLSHYRVGEVLDVGAEYPSRTYAAWRRVLRDRHIPVYALSTGTRFSLDGATVEALAPDGVRPRPTDAAGILRVDLPGGSVLLTGAASVGEQRDLVFAGVRLRAGMVVASSAGVDAAFAQAVHARRRVVVGSSPVRISP